MKVLFFILNKEELLEEVLEALLEIGVAGATVIDSVGMGSILTHDIPIFAGFKHLMQGSRPANKTIVSVIEDKMVQPIVAAIEQVVGPLSEPGNGIAFVLPVDEVFGLRKTF